MLLVLCLANLGTFVETATPADVATPRVTAERVSNCDAARRVVGPAQGGLVAAGPQDAPEYQGSVLLLPDRSYTHHSAFATHEFSVDDPEGIIARCNRLNAARAAGEHTSCGGCLEISLTSASRAATSVLVTVARVPRPAAAASTAAA